MNVYDIFERIPMPIKRRLPTLDGANTWLNSEPLDSGALGSKVILVDFWTYTCVNWIRTLPHLRAWNTAYAEDGLVIVGVHTPEFSIERDADNVRRAARALRVEYPIAIDNDYAIWNAFGNQFWPALYVADHHGRIRHQHFGEGGYERSEEMIRRLLVDAGAVDLPAKEPPPVAQGIEIEADTRNLKSPETYVGLARSYGFANRESRLDEAQEYERPAQLSLNRWALAGNWTVHAEHAVSNQANAAMTYRFQARDLNMVMAPPVGGTPVRFIVRLGGEPPQTSNGLDVDAEGRGILSDARLYQLIRQPIRAADGEFEIEFLDPGARAFCFTFG